MRIAIVTEFYYPTYGGVQEHVFHLARECRRLGHEVSIITSRVDEARGAARCAAGWRAAESGVVRVARSLAVEMNGSVGRVSVGLDLDGKLRRLLVPARFDVVHVHSPLTPVLPPLAIRHTTLPVVGTFHTNFGASRLLRLLRSRCQSIVDRIDANVAVSAACIRALSPYVAADFRVIPNGVDCAAFAGGRRRESPMSDGPVVLVVSRLEERSGVDRLLRAWPGLEGRPRLVVVGDGPWRARLTQLAAEVGADARFVGAQLAERPDWFASADLLVCPTTIASFGVTLLEGMAAGLPIVASDIDGFREVLTDGREGLLVDTAQAGLLAGTISGLLADPARRRTMAAAGRETARRYDWSTVAGRIIDVYQEISGAR